MLCVESTAGVGAAVAVSKDHNDGLGASGELLKDTLVVAWGCSG